MARVSHYYRNTKIKPRKTEKAKKISWKKKAQKEFSHIQFHGAKMLASGESRWYWVPLLLLLLLSAIALIHLAVSRFRSYPTFVAYKELDNKLMNFPCVLVYPELEFHESKKELFISNITYPDGLNETYIRAVIDQLAAFWSPDVIYKLDDLENIEKLLKHNELDIETAAEKLIFSCEEIILRCQYNQILYNCSEMFTMELAGDGYTCVFNGRSLSREMREHAKVKNSEVENKKWITRSPRSGLSSGLMLAIDQRQKLHSIDLSYKWIAIQVGQRYVDTTLNGTALNPGSEQWMIYQEDRYYINDKAKNLRTALRNCRMGDHPLKYFPNYRRRYCILECEIAKTINLCNCVRRVHPKPPGVRYCTARDMMCTNHAMVSYGNSCHCLSTCEVEIDSVRATDFPLDPSVVPLDHFYSGLDFNRVTIVRIFIQAGLHKTFQRFSLFTHLDLFAQLGGIFNVFFGCSILTLLGLIHVAWRISVNKGIKYLKKLFKSDHKKVTSQNPKEKRP